MNQATISSQLGNMPCRVKDTDEMIALREAEEWQKLGDALVGQYRFREAAAYYEKALCQDSTDIRLCRCYAGANLTLRNFRTAEAAYRQSLNLGANPADIAYSMGFSTYLQRDYVAATVHFAASYPCDEEQEIAVIYWHTLAACRAGVRRKLLDVYREGMNIGHHTAYEMIVRLFCGLISPKEVEAWIQAEEDELNKVVALYGMVIYYESTAQQDQRERALQDLLAHDTYWPSLPYLAAWADDSISSILNANKCK